MNWQNDRPEGWEEKAKWTDPSGKGHPDRGYFEAGADALLALLRASGTKTDSFRTNHNPIYMSNPNQRGVYVFIPAKKN